MATPVDVNEVNLSVDMESQLEADHRLALALAAEENQATLGNESLHNASVVSNASANSQHFRPIAVSSPARPYLPIMNTGTRNGGVVSASSYEIVGGRGGNDLETNFHHMDKPAMGNNGVEMSSEELAHALQALEIQSAQMNGSTRVVDPYLELDFMKKEFRAAQFRNQLQTWSLFICLVQIGLFIGMVERAGGLAPMTQNTLLGPNVIWLVRFGAKEASLIVYDHQWWRLVSGIMTHAGILHIAPNVFIQLRVGGYINVLLGWWRFLLIYFLSGIFGFVTSCIFEESTVGVGSSGALLGILMAWVVFILFRWKKVPEEFYKQRTCQLGIVVIAVVVTLATSFAPYVDWAAHFGGAVQGTLLSCVLLSHELDNINTRIMMRVTCGVLSIGLYGYALFYVAFMMRPSTSLLAYFNSNDDWQA